MPDIKFPSIKLPTLNQRKQEGARGAVNAAKTLLANIRFMSVDNPIRTVVITSSVPNEGKTFVAMNLAVAMATSGASTLLVECDMRRRSIANSIGAHAKHGIYAVVSGSVPLEEAMVATRARNLYFLDSEPQIPNPSDFVNSKRFAKFMNEASKMFDYVVFDTPPVGTFIDAAVIGSKTDATFMVVRENFAKRDEVAAAAKQLQNAGCNLAGVVMNYCESHKSEYYYEQYYSRGHNDMSAPSVSQRQQEAAAESTAL